MNGKQVRVAACEAQAGMLPESEDWQLLARRVRWAKPDIVLLNEMPFGPWISAGKEPDPVLVRSSCALHEQGLALLQELGAPVVLGTRPIKCDGRLVNEAFVWSEASAIQGVHTKQYFPNEAGYYEARWFEAGERHFRVAQAGGLGVGFLICTEVMFNEHARHYGRQGAHLIAVPRAVGGGSLARWLTAIRMAAIVSGCYVLSSNRSGVDATGQRFGGRGWIVEPSGEMVAQTSSASPVVCYEIDLNSVSGAQREYPCYVPEIQ